MQNVKQFVHTKNFSIKRVLYVVGSKINATNYEMHFSKIISNISSFLTCYLHFNKKILSEKRNESKKKIFKAFMLRSQIISYLIAFFSVPAI